MSEKEIGIFKYAMGLAIGECYSDEIDEIGIIEIKTLKIIQEKQELIKWLEELEEEYKKGVQFYEARLRETNKEDFYYLSHLKNIHKYNAKRELIKEILDKAKENK